MDQRSTKIVPLHLDIADSKLESEKCHHPGDSILEEVHYSKG